MGQGPFHQSRFYQGSKQTSLLVTVAYEGGFLIGESLGDWFLEAVLEERHGIAREKTQLKERVQGLEREPKAVHAPAGGELIQTGG